MFKKFIRKVIKEEIKERVEKIKKEIKEELFKELIKRLEHVFTDELRTDRWVDGLTACFRYSVKQFIRSDIGDLVQENIDELLKPEQFIDDVVKRIKKKQLN